MKFFVVLMSLALSVVAFADPVALRDTDVSIKTVPADAIKISHVGPYKCPPGQRCPKVLRTEIKLSLVLEGCLDRLGPSATRLERRDDGSAVLLVSATEIKNVKSDKVKCVAPNTKSITVKVLGHLKKNDLELVVID